MGGVEAVVFHEAGHVLGLAHFTEGKNQCGDSSCPGEEVCYGKSGNTQDPFSCMSKDNGDWVIRVGAGDLNAFKELKYLNNCYDEPFNMTSPDEPLDGTPYINLTYYNNTYPKIYWDLVGNAESYKIYRRTYEEQQSEPVFGEAYLFTTVGSTTTSYTDYSKTKWVIRGGPKQYVYYQIKAENDLYSDTSNWKLAICGVVF